jgi:transposase
MSTPDNLPSLSRVDLLAMIAALQHQVAVLTAVNAELCAEIERLKRDTKRQAAPFSKGTRSAKPRRPGRKPGKGMFRYRQPPLPHQLSGPPIDVPVAFTACPGCGGPLAPDRVDVVSTTDLPPLPRPQVRQYRVTVCRCLLCGQQVRGQHPDVAPDQYGATAPRGGARAMAAAHALHYGSGIPVRKVPRVLATLTGLELTQGAITQDALRRAAGSVGMAYAQLRTTVPAQPIIHTDDTGWRVGGVPAYLMVFETDTATVYQIRSRHRHQEVQEVIPVDYQGVMVTDRGRSYDAHAFADVPQQKCLAHILRTIHEVLKTKKGRARDFGERLKTLLQEAIELWRAYHRGDVNNLVVQAQHVRDVLMHHLRDRCLIDPDNQRLLNSVGRQHDRGNVLRFLDDPRIEPTNNRAERALRPAVIARKVSQCSKTERGAHAYAAFSSVVRTLAKQGVDSPVEGLYSLFQIAHLQGASP